MTISSLLSELNTSQIAAATFRDQHALILAGAGCGKTKTIIARAAYLISEGVRPERIQILTFTRRAASEIVERVRMHLGDAAIGLKASTFHTWCVSLIRRAPAAFGCKDYSVIDRDDQLQLFKVLRGQSAKSKLPTAAQLCDIYSFARNTLQTLDAVLTKTMPASLASKRAIASVMLGYEARKRDRRYLDYDDLLDIVAQRMATSPATQEWVARQYDHVLVDEMQDTNPLQWKLLSPLQNNVKIFCVGDDAQSIYGFRGADFQNIHSFSERVPGSVTLRLEQNYRSTQEILDVSNWLLSESPLAYGKKLIAVRGTGNKPQLRTFSNEWEEGRWIADDLVSSGTAGSDWRSHMILARSAFAARVVESALVAKDIPYCFVGGTKLLESAHVRDLFAVFRIVGNPQDEIAWMRYLTLWPGIGEVTANRIIVSLLSQGSLDDCIESIRLEIKIPPLASKVVQIVLDLQSDVSKAVSHAAQAMDKLLAAKYKSQEWDRRKADFKLVEKLAGKHSSILAFIEEYLLNPVHGTQVERGETEDVVTVTTIHSAKGTECDVCYVINVSPGAFPLKQAQGDEDETEEERRVLYVALTRAKNELIVTRQGHGIWASSGNEASANCDAAQVSPYFLNSVPESSFEHHIEQTMRLTRSEWFEKDMERLRQHDGTVGISVGYDLQESVIVQDSVSETVALPLEWQKLSNARGLAVPKVKLKVLLDSKMEEMSGLTIELCTAYLDTEKIVLVVGELISKSGAQIDDYKQLQLLVLDVDNELIERSYTNWGSFGLRQSFRFQIDTSDFDAVPVCVKVYPANY